LVGLLGIFLFLGGCGDDLPATPAPSPTPDYSNPQVTVLVDGLFGPIGLAELPHGGILVAEEGTGGDDASAGISLITPDGEVGRLISGLPSTRDAGDLAGVPMIVLAPDGSRLYLSTFGQDTCSPCP
jgi:glucose/arabinose dehydrogenase